MKSDHIMTSNQSGKRALTGTERNRTWRERNADRNKQLAFFLPRTAHELVQQAGEKSGLSMAGLMLACLEFLGDTDGQRLQELAAANGKLHGFRVQIEDPASGKVTRVRAGRYRKGAVHE